MNSNPAPVAMLASTGSGWFVLCDADGAPSLITNRHVVTGEKQPLRQTSELTRPAARGRLRVYLLTVAAIRVRYRTASGAQPIRVQRVVRRNLVHRADAGVCHGCCQRGAPKQCSRVRRSRSLFTAARHAGYQLAGGRGSARLHGHRAAADDCLRRAPRRM